MSQIYIPKEVSEKFKKSPKDKNTAILLSNFDPERHEKPKYKDFKTKRKMERIRELRKTDDFKKKDKNRTSYENGEISLEEYQKRKLNNATQSLATQLKKIRIKKGMETQKIKHFHAKNLGYSNRSVFRADDKDLWPYKK